MSHAIQYRQHPVATARFGDSPLVLGDIYEDGVSLSAWQRRVENDVHQYAEGLTRYGRSYASRQVVSLADIRPVMSDLLPEQPGRQIFIDDIYLLADLFTCLFGLEEVGLRVAPLTSTMCPRFHTDRVPCRLLCTYGRGPGTQWLADTGADRRYLGTGSRGLPDEESGLIRDPGSIFGLNAGDVALLKGEAWPDNEGRGLIHRSPALARGESRLLLSLDFT